MKDRKSISILWIKSQEIELRSAERGMNAMLVVIRLKVEQFAFEICRSPEQDLIKELAPYCSAFQRKDAARHRRHG